MTQALTLDSKAVALELHQLLRDLDPARWTDELASSASERLERIRASITRLLDVSQPSEQVAAIVERLRALAELIAEHAPSPGASIQELRGQWEDFRSRAQPAYEALAASLRAEEIHVPSLRPSNYTRNIFHVFGGLSAVLLIEMVLGPLSMLVLSGAFLTLAVVLEVGRRVSPPMNDLLMRLFGRVAHPHERHRVNSSSWYCLALFVIALTGRPMLCAMAVAVLGLADPAAAVVGRRWGRVKLVNGRSLEGSLMFAASGTLAAWAVLSVWHTELIGAGAVLVAAGAAVPAAVAELFSRRVDDNFSIPVSAAAGGWVMLSLLGLA